MFKNNYKIILVALMFGALAWLGDVIFDLFSQPYQPFLDLLVSDRSPHEFYERLLLSIFVTVSVVIVPLKTVSLHQKTKEALWEGESLLAGILDGIQEGLIIKDRDFNIVRINPVVARWYDYAMPLVGRKCYEALKGLAAPCPDCPAVRAMESGKAAHEVVPKPGPGGQEAGWLDLYAYPLVDAATGERNGVVEFARDITQSRQTQEALRESETRYRMLVNNIPAVVFKGYGDWRVQFVDHKIEALTGYHQDEFNSGRLKWRDLILPEDLEETQRLFVQALKTSRSYIREYRIKRKDGRVIWIQARGQIICDPAGKIDYVSGVFFDITESKQAEEAVARLASFPQLNPDPVLELDPSSGRITYCNPAAIQALEKLEVSEGPSAFLPPDMDQILKTPEEENVSRFYREVQIKEAVFAENIEFVPQYQVTRIRAFDITEHKRAENALRKSQVSLAEAQRLAHLGNGEWQILSNEVLWSDEIYRIFGLTPRGCRPSFEAYLQAVHPADRQRAKQAFKDALRQGKPYKIGHRVIRPDGSERFVNVQGEFFFDDSRRAVRMLGTVQDITAPKQAEAALAESEKRYRLLAEHVTDVIWTMDLQMNLTFVSPSLQWLTGYDAGECLGFSLEQMLTPASQELARNKLQEMLAREADFRDTGRSVTLELELLRQDGSTVWAEVNASLLRDDQERPVGLLGVTRDISARRKLEAQLQQAQKMEVVGRLAGGVAHDFNNLLTAILGYSEILLANLDVRDSTHQDAMEIKKAGERAALLTRQLLAFSRRQVLQPKSLQLNLVVENLAKMLKPLIGEDIGLEIISGPNLGRVMVDPGQIEQVILNLTVNARDAMPRGGKLTIQTANVTLDEAYTQGHAEVQSGRYVLLAVTDTGCGMDTATRSHIFEPFFTTKELGKGTGLGLSMVYGIVRQSNGHIWVYSEPGQGSTFKIYLPRVAAKAEAALPVRVAEATPQGHETILLVEDDDGVRQIAGRILRRSGYQVLEAREGGQALQICREHRGDIHLVLTDLVMPGINGRDLVLRLASLRPGIKVIFMSGYAEDYAFEQDGLDTGLGFIQKPFEAQALTRKIWEQLHSA